MNNDYFLIRLTEERGYRRKRSKLKKKIRMHGKVSAHQKKYYNLSKYIPYEPIDDHHFLYIHVPKKLCFIEDHDGTFEFLIELEKILSRKKPIGLNIRHNDTEKIGLAASSIFDNIIQIYITKWKRRGVRVNIKGHLSNVKSVNNFLLSFGLLSGLNISNKFALKDIDYDYKSKYVVFKMQGSSSSPYLKSEASTKLVDYFRKCLNYSNIDLTSHGYGMLVDAIGEIIGNAEEHSDRTPAKWSCLGCYDKDSAQCGFSIFNYGATIYESLSGPKSTSTKVIQAVADVISNSKSILQKLKNNVFAKPSEEPIWNVMAIQDGISSKRTEQGPDSTRGHGLMDVVEFVETLRSKGDPVKISIISGRSKIIIDYAYPIIKQTVNQVTKETRRLLPFNKEGNLKIPADPTKVFYMDHQFNGVIITGYFKINEEYLTQKLEKTNVRD